MSAITFARSMNLPVENVVMTTLVNAMKSRLALIISNNN
nr:unnamed protein product [Callosobruchus analis]